MTSRQSISSAAKPRIPILLLVAVCLAPALARAQVSGGAGATPNDFKLTLSLGGGYSSNPGLRSESGELRSDSIANLRAAVAEHRSSARTDWSARYDAFYTHYGSNDQLDSINHALYFDGRYLLTRRAHIKLLESFFYSRNPLQIGTTTPENETIILTRLTNRWRSVSDGSIDTVLSRSLTLQVGASSRIERLDLTPSVDINTYAGRIGILKQIDQKNSLATTYSYSRFSFHRDTIFDAETNGVDLSWSHGPLAGPGYVLSAGVSRVTGGGDSQNRVTAGATLHHPFRRVDFVSGYHRSLDADAGVATVTVAQNAYAGITGSIGRSGTLGGFGEYGTRDSVLETGDEVALKYAGGAIRASFALNPRFSISGEARRRKQTTSSSTAEDLTVDTFFLGLVFQLF
jgi:hypothetical protein